MPGGRGQGEFGRRREVRIACIESLGFGVAEGDAGAQQELDLEVVPFRGHVARAAVEPAFSELRNLIERGIGLIAGLLRLGRRCQG